MSNPPLHPPAGRRTIEYDLDALRNNIVRCDTNIVTFETAIANEEVTKKRLHHMISVIEAKHDRSK